VRVCARERGGERERGIRSEGGLVSRILEKEKRERERERCRKRDSERGREVVKCKFLVRNGDAI